MTRHQFALLFVLLLLLGVTPTRVEADKMPVRQVTALAAIQKAFGKLEPTDESAVTDVAASLKTAAELLVGLRGTSPELFLKDRTYWEVRLRISATSQYHAYWFRVVVDAKTGEIVKN